MLSAQENELVTKVTAGTPMGELMRSYWLPALLSSEVPVADCPPVRVKLLGEALIAFRDSNGRMGIVDEFCPHRRASLWLGRNEESGLRCVYHGWKFDVNGVCLEQMNEPVSFADKIKAKSYPAIEQGDVIWTYMGSPEKQPPPPNFEYTRVPETHRAISKVWEECNWLQALEGGIDTSHAPILHRSLSADGRAGISQDTPFVRGGAPTLEVDITDYGYQYSGVRPLGEDEQYVRAYHFIMPFTQLRPQQGVGRGPERKVVAGHHWVPIDDDNCMVWNWHYSYGDEPLPEHERSFDNSGNGAKHVNSANEYRAYGNRRNGWNVDREMQKAVNFTGIEGINAQDRAVQESMGTVVDRSLEHLGPADRAIITTRRLLLDALKVVEDGGLPKGAAGTYYNIRASEKVFLRTKPWREVLHPELYPEPELQTATA
jgi:phthalate 4,5-dioxygenase